MSTEVLRDKANRLYAKSRFLALFGVSIGLILGALFAGAAIKTHDLVPRLGWGVLSLWVLYSAYQAYQLNWPKPLPAGAPIGTSLSFYRTELEKQRDHLRHVWLKSGLPFCFLGLAMVVGPGLIAAFQTPRLLVNVVPFLVLLLVWFVAFLNIRKRQQRAIQQDIDELRAYERGNPA